MGLHTEATNYNAKVIHTVCVYTVCVCVCVINTTAQKARFLPRPPPLFINIVPFFRCVCI